MEPAIQRALNDKLYDKRKVGALECVVFLSLLSPILKALFTPGRIPGLAGTNWLTLGPIRHLSPG